MFSTSALRLYWLTYAPFVYVAIVMPKAMQCWHRLVPQHIITDNGAMRYGDLI